MFQDYLKKAVDVYNEYQSCKKSQLCVWNAFFFEIICLCSLRIPADDARKTGGHEYNSPGNTGGHTGPNRKRRSLIDLLLMNL